MTSELSPWGSEVSGAHTENRSKPGGRRARCEYKSDRLHVVSLPNRSFPSLSIKLRYYLQRSPSRVWGAVASSSSVPLPGLLA